MNRKDMEMFAANWIANWNARDLDAILAHFAEDARFISPLAAELIPTCTDQNPRAHLRRPMVMMCQG